jgi:hypothetical protein
VRPDRANPLGVRSGFDPPPPPTPPTVDAGRGADPPEPFDLFAESWQAKAARPSWSDQPIERRHET